MMHSINLNYKNSIELLYIFGNFSGDDLKFWLWKCTMLVLLSDPFSFIAVSVTLV